MPAAAEDNPRGEAKAMHTRPGDLIFLALLIPLASCEWMDGHKPPPPDRDLTTDPDVPTDTILVGDGSDDAADVEEEEVVVEECDRVVEEFDPLATRAGYDDTWGQAWKVQGTFTPGFLTPPVDIVDIESWRNLDMVEDGPWTEGVYTIDGWVHRSWCGLCVFYFEGCTIPNDSDSCEHAYNAIEATLDLDRLEVSSGGLVIGDLTGLYMVEVDWDTGQRIAGGTSFCLDLWTFIDNFESMSLPDWQPPE